MPAEPIPVVIEVTNTLLAPSITGYQRFVREIVRELSAPGTPALEVVPVVWDAPGDCYRRLTPDQAQALRQHTPRLQPAPGVGGTGRGGAARTVLVRGLRIAARNRLGARGARWFRQCQARPTAQQRALRLPALPAGAVFLDLEPAWHDPAVRAELLPRLRKQDTTVVTMVADVLPELHPEWFEPRVARAFSGWLRAHLQSSQLCLTISANTCAELHEVAERDGLTVPPSRVVPLGANFAATGARPVDLPAPIGRYLLVVGTIEPRKNHALVLDLFDRLATSHPDLGLVLVGKQGWLVPDTIERIRSHPLHDERLLWLSRAADDELVWLYQHAFLALAPSFSEGLGLPVMEALWHGVPTISSTGGALPEAGGDAAEYAAPNDLDAWEALVTLHLSDDGHHQRARARAVAHAAPTWSDAGAVVRQAIAGARSPARAASAGSTGTATATATPGQP